MDNLGSKQPIRVSPWEWLLGGDYQVALTFMHPLPSCRGFRRFSGQVVVRT
jgi:hypothetical protein